MIIDVVATCDTIDEMSLVVNKLTERGYTVSEDGDNKKISFTITQSLEKNEV